MKNVVGITDVDRVLTHALLWQQVRFPPPFNRRRYVLGVAPCATHRALWAPSAGEKTRPEMEFTDALSAIV